MNNNVGKPLALALLNHPDLLIHLTCLTLILERFATLLLFLPNAAVFRSAAIILFIVFHLCIDLTLQVGWFSWIMIIYWLSLVPSEFWKRKTAGQNKPQASIKLNAFSTIIISILFGVICISNFFYMQNPEIKALWKKSIFYKAVHYLAIDQDFLKFAPANTFYRDIKITPIFDSSSNADKETYKKYKFERTPYFRTGRILHWRGSREDMTRHYDYLKKYLKDYWNNQFPQGPRVVDVKITVKTEKILPYKNKRQLMTTEKF